MFVLQNMCVCFSYLASGRLPWASSRAVLASLWSQPLFVAMSYCVLNIHTRLIGVIHCLTRRSICERHYIYMYIHMHIPAMPLPPISYFALCGLETMGSGVFVLPPFFVYRPLIVHSQKLRSTGCSFGRIWCMVICLRLYALFTECRFANLSHIWFLFCTY